MRSCAALAQLVEHVIRNDGVPSSILGGGSRYNTRMMLFWILVFLVSLAVLIKGSDILLGAAERIGLAFGLSPFVVGVVVIGFGTSLPELASSLAGVFVGASELVAANVVGSNIANILLIAGFAAIAGGRLTVGKSLMDLDIPMLTIATVFFISVAYDGVVTRGEAAFLLLAFAVYIFYTFLHKDEKEEEAKELLHLNAHRPTLSTRDLVFFVFGLALLIGGAKYVVDSVLALSSILGIGVGVISLVAVAIGTSMPELVVSIRAGLMGKADVSLGNIFGSNVFNLLMVVGLPGLLVALPVDAQTLVIGLPVLAIATFIFAMSTLSNQVYKYEGAMYLLLYALFLGKLAGLL